MVEAGPGEIMDCWTCKYQQVGGSSFLGLCTFFKIHRAQEPKEIPMTLVDVGCKFFEQRQDPVLK